MTRPTRKLTTILAADVVGFSKLMDQHEELTLKNLKTCRDIVDPIITESPPAATALATSPENLIPPSAIKGIPAF